MSKDAAYYREYRERRKLQGKPLVDDRKGNRHKSDRNRPVHSGGKDKTKWERRRIVAWDGEGCNTEDGVHIYNLLANSNGERLVNPDGIPTRDALNFLIKYGDSRAINVIYGGSYDVNMILRDMPIECIKSLWTEGDCYWEDFRVFYSPRKKLTVQKLYMLPGSKKIKKHTFTLWDVLGFYQSTFVSACRKWLGPLPILDDIERMKFERSVFTADRLQAIIEYNHNECLLLVKLMEALFNALDSVDIKLIRYDGAGAIASTLLRVNEVNDHKGTPDTKVLRFSQFCYSGGRIEAPKIGNEERPIYRYDINSAYPYSCLSLPSYKGASWSIDSEWDGQDCSMVRIRWDLSDYNLPFNPLWFREHDGRILYPTIGEGIYWGVEARNIIDYYPGSYDIIEACNVHLATDYKPFGFLRDMYHARQVLKAAGNMASEAFKLGMNSTYGKLAQQAGYRHGRIPTYHQLLWAGQITAHTRAQLYNAAMQKPGSVIAFATDAIITTEKLSLCTGEGLGEWSADSFDGITIVQPGVYWLKDKEGWYEKYRGFDKGSLLREHIVGCWLLGQNYHAKLTRFVGMGSALASTEFYKHWRSWEVQERILTLAPSGKRSPSNDVCYWEQLCDTIPVFNMECEGISKPYPLLWVDGESHTSYKDDVDLRLIEQELMDSYA